jgi:hypothetical protein
MSKEQNFIFKKCIKPHHFLTPYIFHFLSILNDLKQYGCGCGHTNRNHLHHILLLFTLEYFGKNI